MSNTSYEQTKKYLKNIEESRNFEDALDLAKSLLEHCEFLMTSLDHKDEIIDKYVTMTKELLDKNERLWYLHELHKKYEEVLES